VPRAESLDATLKRKPHVAEPPKFDTTRQISTLFAVSAAQAKPPAPPTSGLVPVPASRSSCC
jgi:hypothetical protein